MSTPTARQQGMPCEKSDLPYPGLDYFVDIFSENRSTPEAGDTTTPPIQSSEMSYDKNLNTKSSPKNPRLLGMPDFATILKQKIYLLKPRVRAMHWLLACFDDFCSFSSSEWGLSQKILLTVYHD